MRAFVIAIAGLIAAQPGAARAAEYLYTFTGVVSYANNVDATYIYANEGDPIAFSLLVKDTFGSVAYSYGPTGSSAIGGPDYGPGTLFPVDRKVDIDPALGSAGQFTPIATGYRTDENYSASVSKDAATKSLSLAMRFERFTPPDAGCTERCSGTRVTHAASALVYSDAFTSPDFREVGSFDLNAGSAGTLSDGYATYLAFGDYYEIALSNLTVTRLPDAVPELNTWLMMIAGLGFAGAAMRGQRNVRTRVTFARVSG